MEEADVNKDVGYDPPPLPVQRKVPDVGAPADETRSPGLEEISAGKYHQGEDHQVDINEDRRDEIAFPGLEQGKEVAPFCHKLPFIARCVIRDSHPYPPGRSPYSTIPAPVYPSD